MVLLVILFVFTLALIFYLFFWKPIPTNHFYPDSHPLFIAHRGLHKMAPENTMSSVKQAIDSGFMAIELDVIGDSRNNLVCSHNIDLERETRGNGFVDEKDFGELQQIYYRQGEQDKSHSIPLLKTILERFKKEAIFILDIKTRGPLDIVLAKKISRLIKTLDLKNSTIVSSFNPLFLLVLKWYDSKIFTGFIFKNPKHIKLINVIHPDLLHPKGNIVDKNLINYSKKKNLPINAWTINNYLSWRWLSSLEVSGIITDELPDFNKKTK
tara:strand:- start:1204 stop:2007 length:804 start_codon:yes stop_codon:yes gene_type:complete